MPLLGSALEDFYMSAQLRSAAVCAAGLVSVDQRTVPNEMPVYQLHVVCCVAECALLLTSGYS